MRIYILAIAAVLSSCIGVKKTTETSESRTSDIESHVVTDKASTAQASSLNTIEYKETKHTDQTDSCHTFSFKITEIYDTTHIDDHGAHPIISRQYEGQMQQRYKHTNDKANKNTSQHDSITSTQEQTEKSQNQIRQKNAINNTTAETRTDMFLIFVKILLTLSFFATIFIMFALLEKTGNKDKKQ